MYKRQEISDDLFGKTTSRHVQFAVNLLSLCFEVIAKICISRRSSYNEYTRPSFGVVSILVGIVVLTCDYKHNRESSVCLADMMQFFVNVWTQLILL